MNETAVFYPPRRLGLAVNGAGILALTLAGGWGLWRVSQAPVGLAFLLYLAPVLAALALVPLLAYRAYALWRAAYTLERDGVHLKWGLRAEDIPMQAVRWVRPAGELEARLARPRLRWPGAVLGIRRMEDGSQVEYLASQTDGLVLIAASDRLYAVSPERPADFLKAYQGYAELGSLGPAQARSVYPSFLLARVWACLPARYLLVCGLALSLLLLALVSLIVPARPTVRLGFLPDGSPGEAVPSIRLLLLPVLNVFFYLADVLAGLFFFRREAKRGEMDQRPLAYLLWGSGALTALLFLAAALLLLEAG